MTRAHAFNSLPYNSVTRLAIDGNTRYPRDPGCIVDATATACSVAGSVAKAAPRTWSPGKTARNRLYQGAVS